MIRPRLFTPNEIGDAVSIVQSGGVIVIPTDTVYGIGCAFDRAGAIERIFSIKHRDPAKSIAVLLSDINQIDQLAESFPDAAKALAEKFWPGALTLVVRKKAGLPDNLASGTTIGLRIPDHELVRELIRRCGPLATTSGNLSGQPAAVSIREIPDDWNDKIDAIFDGGTIQGGKPSAVVDCTVEPLRILREGALTADMLGLTS